MKLLLSSLLCLFTIVLPAQDKNGNEPSLVKNLPFSNVGPTVMSGRVVDIAVNPENTIEFYVAYASGGLWYTDNNGISFSPVMDNAQTINIGDIAIDWKKGTIWIGTGENNASRSSYAGIGILKSTDKGKTWQNMGLKDSHHIGRILINPNNPDEIIVGATGHLYSKNEERGIYKSVDGGQSWTKTLFVNDNSGIIDLVAQPTNFNVLYATAWQKDRKAWNFTGSGASSGIYKSTDAGDSWSLISTVESGFPTGDGVGRIGLAVFDEHTIYAVHDSQFREDKKEDKDKKTGLNKEDFKQMSTATFLELDDKELNNFLKTNGFQEKYRAQNVKQLVSSGTAKPIDLAKFLENANSLLFDTPVIGAEIYRSNDGGKTWTKQNTETIDGLFFSYGYYFAQISVAPQNKDHIYVGGVLLFKSTDGGKTLRSIQKENVHADHHSIWLNPNKAGHIINGNDGGVNISYDDGAHWSKNNAPAVGQFYAINVDNEKPYNIYGGLQDNGVWKGPNNAKEDRAWEQSGHYAWESIMGGDGMQIQIDARDADVVYTGFQFGNYYRLNLKTNKSTYIQPKHNLGETPYRFNWQTPILLSSHNQDILYLGGNKLHRSLDRGDHWETISNDLTNGGKKGNVAYGTLTTISESPFKFGLIYTGSDDGLIQLTRDGGVSWKNLSNTLPKNLWVSRVVASSHKKGVVYAALNGYRSDDFKAYVYKSTDFGNTWEVINANLPISPVNVIIEDPENENLLYIGTDNGVYISFNRGANWQECKQGLPKVAVHDLVIQEREKHLLVGTHGRSIYKTDIAQLQKITPDKWQKPLFVFALDTINHTGKWGNDSPFAKAPTPGLEIYFITSKNTEVIAKIKTKNGVVVSSIKTAADKGLNVLSYNVAFDEEGLKAYSKKNKKPLKEAKNGTTYLPKGNYSVEINANGKIESQGFTIE